MATMDQSALKDVAGEHNDVFAETYAERGCEILVSYLHVRHMVYGERSFTDLAKLKVECVRLCQTAFRWHSQMVRWLFLR